MKGNLPASSDHYEARVCRLCSRRLAMNRKNDLCPACEEQQLFCDVRDYIRANDVKDWQVAEHFGIPVAKVKRWIREGRIQYKDEKSPREVIMANYCQICGSPVAFGTICSDCMRERKRKERHGVAIGAPKTEHNKMQFIDEEERGRKS